MYSLLEIHNGKYELVGVYDTLPNKLPNQLIYKGEFKPTKSGKFKTVKSVKWDLTKLKPTELELLKKAVKESKYSNAFRIHNEKKLSDYFYCCSSQINTFLRNFKFNIS